MKFTGNVSVKCINITRFFYGKKCHFDRYYKKGYPKNKKGVVKMAEYASKGVAGSGLGLGVAGTALGVLNSGGLLNGLFNGGRTMNSDCVIDTRQISALEADLAREKAERYADSVGIGVYKEAIALSNKNDAQIQADYRELAQKVAELDKYSAVNDEKIACLSKGVEREFRAVRDEFGAAIALEAERRTAGDQNLYSYVNATFVPGKLVMPKDSICPEVMARYNSWTAPTTAATNATPTV